MKSKSSINKNALTEKIIKRPDGNYEFVVDLTKDQAEEFYHACNLVSEKLGQPVSKGEAIEYMLEFALKEWQKELE